MTGTAFLPVNNRRKTGKLPQNPAEQLLRNAKVSHGQLFRKIKAVRAAAMLINAKVHAAAVRSISDGFEPLLATELFSVGIRIERIKPGRPRYLPAQSTCRLRAGRGRTRMRQYGDSG
jgi:hypothetical protein